MSASPSPLPVPGTVPVVYTADAAAPSDVTSVELEWTFDRRPLLESVDEATLAHHYGAADAAAMIRLFAGSKALFLPLLLWCGVGTRFAQFASFLDKTEVGAELLAAASSVADVANRPAVLRRAFTEFGRTLGRVTTYRALSLRRSDYQRIWDMNEIFPTGQLTQPPEALTKIVDTHGVRKVVVARLYIAHLRKMIGFDPSISLHDDWQTTTIIASGYLGGRGGAPVAAGDEEARSLYLFEVSVPVIESLGWTLARVAEEAPDFLGPRYAGHEPWFNFKAPCAPEGVWFDATIQRTERYGLYTMPHLRERLRCVWKFDTLEQVAGAVAPFVAAQAALNAQYPQGQGAAA